MVISNLVLVLARKICIPSKSLDFNPDKSVSYLLKNSMQYSQLYLMTVRFTPNDKLSLKIFIFTGMEINDANLTELLGHLQKTLSPDGVTRKSGNKL